jgi:hypothetical protein
MFTVKLGNEGVFFPWPGEPEGSENGIKMRRLNGENMQRLDAETVTIEQIFRDGEIYEHRVVDEKKRTELRLDMTITGWKGLADEEAPGTEIPCTLENKVRVMLRSNVMARFIGECITKIEAAENRVMEAERKNSRRSRNGS